jgi:hypothetical protein
VLEQRQWNSAARADVPPEGVGKKYGAGVEVDVVIVLKSRV